MIEYSGKFYSELSGQVAIVMLAKFMLMCILDPIFTLISPRTRPALYKAGSKISTAPDSEWSPPLLFPLLDRERWQPRSIHLMDYCFLV